MSGQYDDIIGLPHHVSATRKPMSMHDRAAQFSPFAALTGHGAAIRETARYTDHRPEPDEDMINALNVRLHMLSESLDEKPDVSVTYFLPDERKAGGTCITETGTVRKIREFERLLVLESGAEIPFDDILAIDGELFGENFAL